MKRFQVTALQVAKYPGYEIGGRFFVIGVPEIIDEVERLHPAFDDPRMFEVIELEQPAPAQEAPVEAASEPDSAIEQIEAIIPAPAPKRRRRRKN